MIVRTAWAAINSLCNRFTVTALTTSVVVPHPWVLEFPQQLTRVMAVLASPIPLVFYQRVSGEIEALRQSQTFQGGNHVPGHLGRHRGRTGIPRPSTPLCKSSDQQK